jgi:hypothetical protein
VAGNALQDLLKLRPEFAATVREDFKKCCDPEYVEHVIDGLRKAGLRSLSKYSVAQESHFSKSTLCSLSG